MQPKKPDDSIPHSLTRLTRALYIRDTNTGTSTRYSFTEFRALGRPSAHEFGSPGDIYLNMKPGSHDLFAKYDTGWKKWPGPDNVQTPLTHPVIPDRYLWFKSDMSAVGWYPQKSLLILQQNPTDLLSLVLKEQVRSATEKKKRKQEDLSNDASTAKKSRLEPPTDLSSSSQVGGLNTSGPQQIPSSSKTVQSFDPSPHIAQSQSYNSGSAGSSQLPLDNQHDSHHSPDHSPSTSVLTNPTTTGTDNPPVPPLPTSSPEQPPSAASEVNKESSVKSGSQQVHPSSESGDTPATSDLSGDPSGSSGIVLENLTPNSDITAVFEEISRLKRENELLRKSLMAYNPDLLQSCEEEAKKYAKEQKDSLPFLKASAISHSNPTQQDVLHSNPTRQVTALEDSHMVLRSNIHYHSISSQEHTTDLSQNHQETYHDPHKQPASKACSDLGSSTESGGCMSTETADLGSDSLVESSATGGLVFPTEETTPVVQVHPSDTYKGDVPDDATSSPVSPKEQHTPSPGLEAVGSTALTSVEIPMDQDPAPFSDPPPHDVSMSGPNPCDTESTPPAESAQSTMTLVYKTATDCPSASKSHLAEDRSISPLELGVGATHPSQLNQSHMTIMFHMSASDMICRLCLQKTPKVVFHVKASSAFDRLEDHCKREHRDVCKYLMAMTDGQLSEMNGRLNVRTKNV